MSFAAIAGITAEVPDQERNLGSTLTTQRDDGMWEVRSLRNDHQRLLFVGTESEARQFNRDFADIPTWQFSEIYRFVDDLDTAGGPTYHLRSKSPLPKPAHYGDW